MTATFPAQSLYGLGVSGPYQLINATLFYVDSFDLTLAASMSQAGSTPTVALSSFDQGPLYFTGQNSASGVANSGAGTFDTLKVLIGVSTPGGGCFWSGDLEDASGNIIDIESSGSQATSPLPVGPGSIELDFDGTKIARANVNGPLVVSRIGVHCSGTDIYANHFFTTPAFTSSQFTGYSTSPVSLSAVATSVLTGASTSVQLTYLGPVSGSAITLSVAGLPTGVTAQFDFPQLSVNGIATLTLSAGVAATPGTYPLTIQALGSSVNKTLTLQITVAQSPITVAIIPPDSVLSVSAGQTLQFTAAVNGTGNQAVTWSLKSATGTISNTGLYSAPSTIASVGSVAVTATSVADPSKSSTLYVTLQSAPPLTAAATTITVVPGSTNSLRISRNATANSDDLVTLSVRGLPVGVSGAFSPSSINGAGSSVLSLSVPSGMSPGTYQLRIVGQAAYVLEQTVSLTLVVAPTAGGSAPNVLVTATPSLLIGATGGTVATTIAVTEATTASDPFILSATGLPSGLTAVLNPSGFNGSGTAVLTLTASPGVAGGSYPITVTAASGTLTQSTIINAIVVPSQGSNSLPSGWASLDIGPVGIAGQTSYGGGVFGLQGAGHETSTLMVATPDQFQFAFSGLTGDGSVVARLLTSNGYAGIMLRDSLDPQAKFVSLGQGGNAMQIRQSGGAASSTMAGVNVTTDLPVWLKLARQGTTITPFSSLDGATWVQSGSTVNVQMGTNVYAGLWTASGSNATLGGGTFDNVSISNAAIGFSLSSSSANLVVPPSGTSAVQITELPTPGFSDQVSLSISGLPSGVTGNLSSSLLSGNASTVLTFQSSPLASPGTYAVTVAGNSPTVTNSTVINVTVSGVLPSGWGSQDVGTVGLAGQTALNNGVFTLQGSGQGIGAGADQFQFAAQSVVGDGSITARLVSAPAQGEAGIMIRNDYSASAAYARLGEYAGETAQDYRPSNGGGYAFGFGPFGNSLANGTWLRLSLQAGSVTGYLSADGINWTQSGTPISISFNFTKLFGLAVSSDDNSSLATAVFDNVTVTSAAGSSGPPSFTSSGSASPNPVNAGQSTTISATVNDTGNPLSNGNIQIFVYDSSGNSVGLQSYSGQNFSSGQSQTYSMQFTPASAGSYTVRLGVFDSNWNLLYWNDLLVSVSVNAGISFTSSGSASPNPVNAGQSTTISAIVNDAGNPLSNGNIQIFVYDSSGNSVGLQNYLSQSFSSGQSQTYSMQFTPASPGSYTVRLGVFDSNWNLLYWNNLLASISANTGISFTSSATAQPLTVSRGSSANISFTVTDVGGSVLNNANVEIQIFDSSWSSVLVQNWSGQNFSASQSLSYSYSWNVAGSLAPGSYYVAVAIYDSAWSRYYWNNDVSITIQ